MSITPTFTTVVQSLLQDIKDWLSANQATYAIGMPLIDSQSQSQSALRISVSAGSANKEHPLLRSYIVPITIGLDMICKNADNFRVNDTAMSIANDVADYLESTHKYRPDKATINWSTVSRDEEHWKDQVTFDVRIYV